jgi:hypothetical protein
MQAEMDSRPSGVIESLGTGFSLAARRPVLLLIPLLLDLFLWLGPRLSISPIASEVTLPSPPVTGEPPENSALLFEQNTAEILGSYNLFSALSTWPLGTPSLLAGDDTGQGPLGTPSTIEVKTVGGLLAWFAALVVLGLLLGTAYLSLVAHSAKSDRTGFHYWARRVWIDWARIVGFVIVTLVAAFLISVPFFLAVEIVSLWAAPLASLGLLIGVGLGMWGLFHLFFVAHGILLHRNGVREAMKRSISLVRQNRLSAAGLLVVAVVISLGLSMIWSLPPSESWTRVVGIAGNAFVSTGLAMATFVFYQDRITD